MDLGQLLYAFARVYVWALLAIGLVTIFVLLLPRNPFEVPLTGVWFAVGGFGALVAIIAVLIYLYE